MITTMKHNNTLTISRQSVRSSPNGGLFGPFAVDRVADLPGEPGTIGIVKKLFCLRSQMIPT